MKKFFYFGIYLVAVVVLLLLLDRAIGFIFDKYLFLKNDPKLEYAYKGGNNEGIIILGASRAAHHYCSSMIEEEFGVTCFNYGMDGRNIFNQYIVLDLLTNSMKNAPKLVLIEVASIDIVDAPGYNFEKLSNLYQLYNKSNSVKQLVEKTNKRHSFALRWFSLYRYNSELFHIAKSFITKESEALKQTHGYEPMYRLWDKEPTQYKEEPFKCHDLKEQYLRNLITICKEKGIPLVLFNSPDYSLTNTPVVWEQYIQDVANEYGIRFFNHAHDEYFIEHPELFNEPFHLNDNGAKVFTKIVIIDIKESYQLLQ